MSAAVRVFVALALLAVFAPAAQAMEFSPWATAVNAEDVLGTSSELNVVDFQDGCPIQSPDRLNLYMASTRQGGHGGIDIWVPSGFVDRSVGRAGESPGADQLHV